MKKILYIFSVALLFLVACTREVNPLQSALSTMRAPQEGDLALVTFYVTVPETPLYSTETRALHSIGEQPNDIENGDLYVAVFGEGEDGLGGQLQHFVKATLMKDPTTPGPGIGVDPPITHDLTGETGETDEQGQSIAGKTFKYAYQVLLPVSEDALVLDFIAGATDSEGNLYNLDNPLPVAYEKDVMQLLLSVNGKAAYWQRVEIPGVFPKQNTDGSYVMAQILDEDGEPIPTEQEEYEAQEIEQMKNIRLVRNFAKVTFTAAEGADFIIKGFYLIDTPVSGSVAPFSGTTGYANAYTTTTDAAVIMNSYKGYILSTQLTSGITDKSFKNPGDFEYMYERTVPDLNKPYAESGAILWVEWTKGENASLGERYYKVSFVNEKGAVPILRNIVYNFQVKAITTDTHPTSAQTAYDGVWLGDISANIATAMLDEITNQKSLIKVSEMSKTSIGAANTFDINFWFYPDVQGHPNDVRVNNGASYLGETVTIQYTIEDVAGYSPAISEVVNNTLADADMGTLNVKVYKSDPGVVKRSKLKILGQWGVQRALYREVEFTVMEKQVFAQDAIVCTVSPLVEDAVNQDVTVTIALPDDLPRDIFPLEVKIEPQNNGLRSIPVTIDGELISALPVKHGKSAFDATKNNYYFVKTITFDDYARLEGSSYVYTNSFPCYFKTRLSTGNETAIKINDLDEQYFIESEVNLSL